MSLEFTEIRILTQENYQEVSPLGDKSIPSNVSLLDKITSSEAEANEAFSKRWKMRIH